MGLKVKGFLDDVDSTKPCKTVIKFFYVVVFKIQMGYLCQTFLKYNKGMTSKKEIHVYNEYLKTYAKKNVQVRNMLLKLKSTIFTQSS